ncbi:hypothetical protein Ciccas_006372 [Cichlidogyrus casuarinus]|uniref:Uncharacterized protein n=1 Tax=Cichlidogyrus casuarinus TaxID=1844966 RepID=A0ABD2Q5Z7_9PLAT
MYEIIDLTPFEGDPSDIPKDQLPLNGDLLRFYGFLKERRELRGEKIKITEIIKEMLKPIKDVYERAQIPTSPDKNINSYIRYLHLKFVKLQAFAPCVRSSVNFKNKLTFLTDLAYFGSCKCVLKKQECRCLATDQLPPHLHEFVRDQANQRQMKISDLEVLE